MHSATTATGRPLPPPGKTLPKNCPAPLSCRAPRQLAVPKPHVTSQLQCYIPAPASIRHSSPVTSHRQINRQPSRLESSVSHTKQTLAPPINRQQFTTSRITNHKSRITSHARSNRHTARLENAISSRKQTLASRSNRHKNTFSASQTSSRNVRLAERESRSQQRFSIQMDTPARTNNNSWNSFIFDTNGRLPAGRQSRLANHQSPLTLLTRGSEFPRSPGESVLWFSCVCCSCNTFRFDEGAASSHLRPLLLYGWRRSRSKQIA
jgi:hypothetical protein